MDINKIKKVLIIAGPGIGDTFLATVIVSSLKKQNPKIEIDFLVRQGRSAYIRNCSQINQVLEFDYKSTVVSYLKMVKTIFRRYDLAFATSHADRFVLAAFYAAPVRAGILKKISLSNFWQHLLCKYIVIRDELTPVSELNLQLLDQLKIERSPNFVFPDYSKNQNLLEQLQIKEKQYIVVHALPRGKWKELPFESWITIVKYLSSWGLPIILTGGPDQDEVEFNLRLAKNCDTTLCQTLAGKTNFAELCLLLKNALFYVGIDTVTSHLAGATGTPCFTIFGSVNHKRWAPRPANSDQFKIDPSKNHGLIKSGSVTICKANCHCVGHPEGCTKAVNGLSLCLIEMRTEEIIQGIENMTSDLKMKHAHEA